MDGMKNTMMHVTYFANGPMIILLFYCHIVLYWEKITSCDEFSHSLTLEVQIGKFKRFNAIDGNIKLLKYR